MATFLGTIAVVVCQNPSKKESTLEGNSFFFRLDLFSERKQDNFDTVAVPESVPISLRPLMYEQYLTDISLSNKIS